MKPRLPVRWLRSLVLLCAMLVTALLPLSARAGDPPVLVPGDAPFVLKPESIKIPAPPDHYEEEKVGDWLVVRYPAGVRSRVEPLLQQAESFRTELRGKLGTPDLLGEQGLVQLHIARSFEDMVKLAPVGLPPPDYAQGVAYSSLRLVLITLVAPHSFEGVDVLETGLHELAHVAIFDATRGNHVPRWFNEGLAIHAAKERAWERYKVLWEASTQRELIPLDDLDRSFPNNNTEVSLAYAQSADFVRFLLRDEDRARTASLFERIREGQSFESALADAYGTDLRRLEYQWQEKLRSTSMAVPFAGVGSLVWAVGALVLVVGYIKRRRKNKQVLDRWAHEEEQAEARARQRLQELERAREQAELALEQGRAHQLPAHQIELPRVQHDGDWHTLH